LDSGQKCVINQGSKEGWWHMVNKNIAKRNPTVSRAVVKLKELSADERARDLYERREKERRDESMRIRGARAEEKLIIAKNMFKRGRHIDEVIEDTGLTREEAESLRR
jgi:predicted transposase/invertase (TIGR01784 family)